jgi:2-(1,2-epoxy-1,2-dihydrophenyl)acetyl-CoA isomerase
MPDVLTARDAGVLTVTLNRPEKLNALTAGVHAGLHEALGEAADGEIRAVVLTGAGRGFCVGQDLTEFQGAAGDVGAHLRATYHPTIHAIRGLDKPVIAAVNGVCAGAGLSLAAACDLRIAADSASFVPGFVSIGLIPDSGGSWFIVQLLGQARAFEFMSAGKPATAAEAHAMGLVDEVVEDAAARAGERAAAYAALPTRAVGLTKHLFEHAVTATLDEQLELEAHLQSQAAQTDDFREGVTAFLEKRPAKFSGR